MEFDELELRLKRESDSLAEEGSVFLNDTEWTSALKKRLSKLGKNWDLKSE